MFHRQNGATRIRCQEPEIHLLSLHLHLLSLLFDTLRPIVEELFSGVWFSFRPVVSRLHRPPAWNRFSSLELRDLSRNDVWLCRAVVINGASAKRTFMKGRRNCCESTLYGRVVRRGRGVITAEYF
ncbi:hypothetical protein AVEN_92982-1 [Araneus ventricosus]|uniref:Uncharacterized protein n=1 Tax=Araneus ventricosus TaxID=182803 RepID=A0A4Y2JNL1_ARAVE|nr:hypothetical protein AVEN_92982-1 [Araneus ventricosus]